jgi:hypothetical protein
VQLTYTHGLLFIQSLGGGSGSVFFSIRHSVGSGLNSFNLAFNPWKNIEKTQAFAGGIKAVPVVVDEYIMRFVVSIVLDIAVFQRNNYPLIRGTQQRSIVAIGYEWNRIAYVGV